MNANPRRRAGHGSRDLAPRAQRDRRPRVHVAYARRAARHPEGTPLSGGSGATRFVFASTGFELEGTTVGLVGAGAIGSRVARILRGFGARVLVFDPYAEPGSLPDGVRSVPLDELLSGSRVVSLHARVTPENREMIAAAQLAAMPPGSVLVNCAAERGRHAALADA